MTDWQGFNKIGIPLMSIIFLLACFAGLFFLCRGSKAGYMLDNKHRLVSLSAQVAYAFMFTTSIFLLFTPVSLTAIILGFVPLVGIYALQHLEVNFIVLVAAVQVYYLNALPGIYYGLAGNCTSIFGDNDYCGVGWITWASILMYWYMLLSLLTAFTQFYFFNYLFVGVKADAQGFRPPAPSNTASNAGGFRPVSQYGATGNTQPRQPLLATAPDANEAAPF